MSVPPRTRAWWATVAGRVGRRVLVGAGLVLGTVGAVAAPLLLPCWIVVGAVVGAMVYARTVERTTAATPVARRECRRLGIVVGAVSAVGCAVVVGLAFLLGAVSGPVILLLALLGARPMWRGLQRARAWRPAPPTAPPVRDRPVIAPVVAPEASTAELCLAWRRSYLALLDTPPGSDRDHIVSLRRDLLDELDRRDPAGFSRWIDTGARAGGDPGRYLGTG